MLGKQTIDLCYVIDCTSSMSSYITAAKQGIKDVITKIETQYPAVEVRVAVVAYRDWCDGDKRIEYKDFASVSEIKDFIGTLKAFGGGDAPEDVFGGLMKATELSWRAPKTRIVYCVCDAPQHNKMYHNLSRDNYPDGHPDDNAKYGKDYHVSVIRAFRPKGLSLFITKQNDTVVKMISVLRDEGKIFGVVVEERELTNVNNMTIQLVQIIKYQIKKGVVSETSAVPIIDTSRIDSREFFKVFVGIDFGTDGTAWGWSKSNNVFIHEKRDVGRKDKTNILLDSDYNPIAFGIEATNLYINQPKKYKNCYYFERFKMSLYDQEMLDMDTPDETEGKYDDFKDETKDGETRSESYLLPANKSLGRVKTQTVFTAAFKYLHNEIMETLDDKGIDVNEDEIQWIVTVPAIWSQFAKNLMRKAVDEAGMTIPGINKHLQIALEPECASVIVREKTGLKKPGTKYVLFDLGGGTADIASHEILSATAIRQIIPPSGGRWGSSYIDEAFIELIGLLFVYGKSKTNPLIEFAKDFPRALIDLKQYFRQAKHSFKGTESIIQIKMPDELLKFLLSKHFDSNDDDDDDDEEFDNDYDDAYEDLNVIIEENSVNIKELYEITMNLKVGDIAIKDCKLALKPNVMEKLFATVLTPTIKHVDNEVLSHPKLSGCKTIFLAGGLTSSSFVKAVITKHYESSMAIYSVDKPFVAVVEGAVKFGLNPSTIKEYQLKHSYGVKITEIWSNKYDVKRKVWNDDSYVVYNVFDRIVKKGAIKKDEPPPAKYFMPVGIEDKKIIIEIYRTLKDDVPYTHNVDGTLCDDVERLSQNEFELPHDWKKNDAFPIGFDFSNLDFRAYVGLKNYDETKRWINLECELLD